MNEQESNNLLKRITVTPGLMSGRPTIRGMRFPVADVLQLLSSGMSEEDILDDFPYIEKEDIKAAILYASKKNNHPVVAIALNEV